MKIDKNLIALVNRKNLLFFSILLGIMFPLIAWVVEINVQDLRFNIHGLKAIHKNNLIIYIVDLAPFVLGGIGYLLGSLIDIQFKRNRFLFLTQERNFNSLLNFAEKIGQGNYNADLENYDNADLSQVLIEMRDKLNKNTLLEKERNWIMKGVAQVGAILREHDEIEELGFEVIKFITGYLNAVQGAFYVLEKDENGEPILEMKARYAYNRKKYQLNRYKIGIGLIGQCAFEKDIIFRTEIPDDYMSITSGLLKDKKPTCILLVPLITNEKLFGVMEFASIEKMTSEHVNFVKENSEIIARTIFNISTNETTRRLLEESQQMSAELKGQQEILQRNAVDMQATQEMLEKQFVEVENQQKKQHALLAKSSEIITIYNKDSNIIFESPSIENILGYTPEEMIGKNDFFRMNHSGEKAVRKIFDEIIVDSKMHPVVEYMYVKKNDEIVWLESTVQNLLADPAIKGIVFNSRDITVRKKAEKEEAMRGKMQALSENSQDIITRFDLKGKMHYVNPKLEYYTGLSKKFSEGKMLKELQLDDTILSGWEDVIKSVKKEKKIVSKEINFNTHDLKLIMQVNGIPEYDKNNEIETVLLVSSDITSRKRQELIIQETNRKITDSINYAKRIQNAIIPMRHEIANDIHNFFLFYKPKDVVSGDFPWYFKKGNLIYFAAVDCTGHGVPGAMMSLIGYLLLNDIVDDIVDLTPSEILDELNNGVVRTLKQNQEGNSAVDGMDVAFCRIDLQSMELQYSGAHRPLYFVRNGELIQYKGDKYAIGGRQYKGEEKFTNHIIKIEKNDSIFFFSDGLPDQFGGPENFKFGPKRIRDLIEENVNKSMPEIEQIFENEFENWKGNEPQFDDVLMIGIRF